MTASPLSARIANEIVQMIQVGTIAADAHLSAQKLADQFGVSRSPIREALQSLADQGVLELRANRGFFTRATAPAGALVGAPAAPQADAPIQPMPSDGPAEYYMLAEDWLRDRVPGEVTEQYLRDRYGLTKAQLVDVLNRATQEGWVERKPGYGWRFQPVVKTTEALEQVYRFRSVIEPAALLEPTFELNREILTNLRRIQENLLAGDIERLPDNKLLQLGAQFHEDIIKLSQSVFFHQALVRVNRMRRLLEYRSMVDRQRQYSQCSEHLEIIRLIERGENAEASYLMRRHLSGAIARKSPILKLMTQPAESRLG